MVLLSCVMLQLDPFLDKIFVMKWVKIFGKSRSGFGQFQSASVEDPIWLGSTREVHGREAATVTMDFAMDFDAVHSDDGLRQGLRP